VTATGTLLGRLTPHSAAPTAVAEPPRLRQPLVDFVKIKNSLVVTITALAAATTTIWMSRAVACDEHLLARG